MMSMSLVAKSSFKWARIGLALVVGWGFVETQCSKLRAEEAGDPLKLFEQRIMPIFNSPKPSSCVQCHLSSVDIKNYILPSHKETFVALREQGLVDVDAPEKSKILTLIRMGDKDLDRGARMIHEKTRKAEYEAFASWIEACCNDPEMRDLPVDTRTAPVAAALSERKVGMMW